VAREIMQGIIARPQMWVWRLITLDLGTIRSENTHHAASLK